MMYEMYLMHHGIKGQKWYIRRYQNEDGSLTEAGRRRYQNLGLKNLKKAKTANMDKWGKSSDMNVAYIAGYSGSGKSTSALSLARKGDNVLHLDFYFEKGNADSSDSESWRDSEFDNFLDKKVPKWKEIADPKTMGRFSKDWWNTVDDFASAIETFGSQQYKRGKRVIAEGVQIADETLHGSKSFYSEKPVVSLSTGVFRSFSQASERDSRGGFLWSLSNIKNYSETYSNMGSNLESLEKAAGAKRGSKWLDDYLKKYGQRKAQ